MVESDFPRSANLSVSESGGKGRRTRVIFSYVMLSLSHNDFRPSVTDNTVEINESKVD